MSGLSVRMVSSRTDLSRFIKFQWVPYQGNPYWVPPLLMDRRKLLDRKSNPFYHHADAEFFLAERDGQLVGRIGAVINRNHNVEHNENIGFFGFFETIDDREVSRALLDTACSWLRERGVEAVRGPVSPSVNDEWGLLVEGYDRSPTVMMPYNPPYYADHLEAYGFRKIRDMFAYQVREESFLSDRLKRVSEIVKQRLGVVIRTLNMKDFENEVDRIRELYIRGWESNWGEVPMTEEEFAYAASDLKSIVDPDLVIISEIKGKPVGFGLTLPDLNEVLIHNKRGRLLPGLVRLLTQKKRIKGCRIMILGVLPEYRNTGLGGVLFAETGIRGVAKGYRIGEASWILEDNVMMIRGAELMNGEITKRYRCYQMPLARAEPSVVAQEGSHAGQKG